MQNFKRPSLSTQAEIRWILKVVYSQCVFRLCLGLSKLFLSMFGGNDTTKHFPLSKSKCSYLISFGLGPYFKDKLLLAIEVSTFYSVLFYESMNLVLQEE